MVGVHEQDDVGFADLFAESVPLLGEGGGVDDGGGGGGGILRVGFMARVVGVGVGVVVARAGEEGGGGDGDLWEHGLDARVVEEDVLDQGGDERGLARALVTADADADWEDVSGRKLEGEKNDRSYVPVAMLGYSSCDSGKINAIATCCAW